MNLLIALQFLTRIPVTIKNGVSNEDMGRSMALFPLVGLFLGTMAAAIHFLSSFVFAGSVCDLIAIVFLVAITGNMHGDGLMDTADGFFSGKPRESIPEIMHDSRVGAHGVMAGACLLLAKFVLLGQVSPSLKGAALVVVPALGRWAQVYAAAMYTYVDRRAGTGSFVSCVGVREMALALSAYTGRSRSFSGSSERARGGGFGLGGNSTACPVRQSENGRRHWRHSRSLERVRRSLRPAVSGSESKLSTFLCASKDRR